MERILRLFMRVASGAESRHEGLGLGLPVAATIAGRSSDRVRVRAGQGTALALALPAECVGVTCGAC